MVNLERSGPCRPENEIGNRDVTALPSLALRRDSEADNNLTRCQLQTRRTSCWSSDEKVEAATIRISMKKTREMEDTILLATAIIKKIIKLSYMIF
uniref:Uncharacterized protein n=1 Tax=Oryza glaberrima TaxID=4538 RepID=A0A679BB28_ORYGL|nr:hypothetical protein [Oryza glaberrima]